MRLFMRLFCRVDTKKKNMSSQNCKSMRLVIDLDGYKQEAAHLIG